MLRKDSLKSIPALPLRSRMFWKITRRSATFGAAWPPEKNISMQKKNNGLAVVFLLGKKLHRVYNEVRKQNEEIKRFRRRLNVLSERGG